ncbi:hypothetical protein XNW1_4360059 [Xenorhabdus nematophila str. Websteri]|nr:hypothetical protein XNW1_4360059 [Xenorhabdus nematophila str. Websteri]
MEAGKGELDVWWGAIVINLSIRAAYPHVWLALKPKSNLNAPFGQLQRLYRPESGCILSPTRGKQSKSNQKAIFGGFHESVCYGFGYWLLQPENGYGS